MGVCVIRTGGRLSIRTDAGAIQPWLDITALPDSPTISFSVALSASVSAFRVLRPIQRQALAYKPFTEVGGTTEQVATVRPYGSRLRGEQLINRTPGDERVKVVCCLRTTTILQAVIAAA